MHEWHGFGIGGLSVGEAKPAMYEMLDVVHEALDRNRPRYLMGVGFPKTSSRESAGSGPVRLRRTHADGRNGAAFTADGRLNIKRAEFRNDPRPLDETCDCSACTRFSRAYIRHLFVSDEISGSACCPCTMYISFSRWRVQRGMQSRRLTRAVEPGLARPLPLTQLESTMTRIRSTLLLQSGANSLLGPIFMYGAIFAIFYFVLIRPGQRQRKAQDALIRQVKRGDEIVTQGGIIGEVIHRETPRVKARATRSKTASPSRAANRGS